MAAKIKWKVSEAPTGRYRSFSSRAWPTAEYANGDIAVALYSDVEYSTKAKEAAEIRVCVADWSLDGLGFKWRTLKTRAIGLTQAKQMAQTFLSAHPEFGPRS